MPSIVLHAWVPLKKDFESSPAAQVIKEAMPKALASANLVHAYRGKGIDPNEPPASELISIFDSVASVSAGRDTEEGKAMQAAYREVADTSNPAVKPMHNVFEFDNDFAAVAAAPAVTLTGFFVPVAQIAAFDAEWAKTKEGATAPDGIVATAQGWALEEVDMPDGKGKIFMVSVGWDSAAKAEAQKAGSAGKLEALTKIAKSHSRVVSLEKLK
ncbi:unnamed protein product [Discula destructiva]